MVARVAHGVADPDPEPAELLRPELIDHRTEPVVPAMAARLAEPQLPEREREVVGDDEQVAERGALAREDFPYGEPGVVHDGEWLDEGELESLVPADRDVRGVTLPPTPRQAGSLREPVEHEPADVVTRPGIPLTRIAEPDDDLHHPSGQHDRARIPSDQVRGW